MRSGHPYGAGTLCRLGMGGPDAVWATFEWDEWDSSALHLLGASKPDGVLPRGAGHGVAGGLIMTGGREMPRPTDWFVGPRTPGMPGSITRIRMATAGLGEEYGVTSHGRTCDPGAIAFR